ncbi:MAG TPA: hypothetical protein VFE53_09450 [Mucilaginibacter sp.]|jgi:hypothetical protein|nr:hypothetical protein [Mucilaginibacter sp.]
MKSHTEYNFKLQFPLDQIKQIASRYSINDIEEDLCKNRSAIIDRGYLTKSELEKIAYWKTPRSKSRIANNSDDYVNEITSIALSTKNEKIRIEILNLMDGVSWPTASVLLHFYHKEKYPIIDFRALFSLNYKNIKPDDYNFPFWESYTNYTRSLSDDLNIDMRTLDRALWQYSKDQDLTAKST